MDIKRRPTIRTFLKNSLVAGGNTILDFSHLVFAIKIREAMVGQIAENFSEAKKERGEGR